MKFNQKWYERNQKELLELANTPAGRHLLNFKGDDYIFKLTPKSVQWIEFIDKDGVAHCKSRIWVYDQVTEWLMPSITKMDIWNDEKLIENKYEAFLHFSGLEENNRKYPQIFLDTSVITPTGGAANAEGVLKTQPNTTWASAYNGSTTRNVENSTGEQAYWIQDGGGDVNWYFKRWFIEVDYTGVNSDATITNLDWSYWCRTAGAGYDRLTFIKSGHSDVLVSGDWDNSDTTQVARQASDSVGTPVNQAFTLNSAVADVTPGTSVIKYAVRQNNDYDNSNPGSGAYGPVWKTSTYSTSAQRPYMTVTYTLGGANAYIESTGILKN